MCGCEQALLQASLRDSLDRAEKEREALQKSRSQVGGLGGPVVTI